MRTAHALAAAVILFAAATAGAPPDRSIVLASTTSTQDSGLFDYLLPIVKQHTGITVRVVAQGTGQALETARRGDCDVVLVHARSEELKFVAEGGSLRRYPVMDNDFVLIGQKSDPAAIGGMNDAARAFRSIRDKKVLFISRGDRSGTNLAELSLWKAAGIDIAKDKGAWYESIGQGMGAALNMASARGAYVLSDRATWANFRNKADLRILVEGDKRMFNQYGVMLVNPVKHPNVKKALGQAFIEFLISPEGQQAIANYRIDGRQVFYPDANAPGA